jgi:serine/threonine protein kinase
MKFSPDCIGKGGMADIYAAEDSSGSRLALKLFRPNYAVDRFARDGWSRRVHHILENVYDLRSVVNKAPFIPLRGIVHASCSPNWYVMDRFDGRSVASVLDAGEELDRGAKHRVVIAYANMLKGLHSQGLLFKDNNWGAVLFNADSVAICDYDMVSRQDELNSGDHFARLVRTPIFCSREDFLTDLPFTCQSELESFALMIDRLILGTYYLGDGYENRMKYEQEAKTYERQYIDLRSAKLPPNLRDVVAGLLNYPRDDSLTVDDFISATDMDLG